MAPNEEEDSRPLKHAKTQDEWSHEHKMSEIAKRQASVDEIYAAQRASVQREEDDIAKSLIKFIQSDAYGSSEPLSEQVSILEY